MAIPIRRGAPLRWFVLVVNLDAISHVLNPDLQGAITLGSIEQSIDTEFASRTGQPPGHSLSDEVMASIPHDETNILLLREL